MSTGKTKYFSLVIPIFICFIVVSLFCGCTNKKPVDLGESANNMELVTPGVLNVGIAPGFYPFESYEDNELVGFDVDIANMIANDLSLELNFVPMKYDNIIDSVKTNEKIDIGISAINITSDRQKYVLFSSPYYSDEKMFIKKSGSSVNSSNYQTYLHNSNFKVAVVSDTTADEYLATNYPQCNRQRFKSHKDLKESLDNNNSDIALVYKTFFDLVSDGNYEIIKKLTEKDECAIAISKKSVNLYQAINKVLAARLVDGTISDYISKWFYIS